MMFIDKMREKSVEAAQLAFSMSIQQWLGNNDGSECISNQFS